MAYLPPDLGRGPPRRRSASRSPAGTCALDGAVDDRPGVGELVYSGPNVMLGYAEDARRPGPRPRRRRAAHRRPRPRTRRRPLRGGRAAQPLRQGLRPADRPRRASSTTCAPSVDRHCAGGDDEPVVARGRRPRRGAPPPRAGRGRCGVPPHAVRVTAVPQVPRLASASPTTPRSGELGRTGRAGGRAGGTASRGRTARPDLRADCRPRARPTRRHATPTRSSASAATRCPTSSSSIRLRPLPRAACPPAGTSRRSASSALRRRESARHRRRRAGAAGARVDTSVALRALAIVLIVGSHVGPVRPRAAAPTCCSRVAGLQLRALPALRAGRRPHPAARPAAALAQLVVPACVWVGAAHCCSAATASRTCCCSTRGRTGAGTTSGTVVPRVARAALALAALLALTLGRTALERRTPFRFALGVLAVAAVRPLRRGRPRPARPALHHAGASCFFALGWAGARARRARQRRLVSALALC